MHLLMRMRLAIGALIVSIAVVSGASSHALPNCSTSLCLWDDAQQTGSSLALTINHHRLTKVPLKWNNRASSLNNPTGFAANFFNRRDGTGAHICVASNTSVDDLSARAFDNKISSYHVLRRTTCPL